MKRYFSLLLILVSTNAFAQDTPIVRVEVTPEQVTVGETIRLRVTVLGPTWFPEPPRYPSFELTNAVVRLPPDSSRPTREQVDGETWPGIVRNYEVIPLIGARFQLDDLVMQVTYADAETVKPIVINVDVPPVEFQAIVPAGAENLDPYIAGSGLELRREFEGETTGLEVGDALVVHYIAELDGLPSMFIPEFLSEFEVPGVSVYAAAPVFSDDDGAVRNEKLTFVFEAGGDFEIPAVSLDWWNATTESIETVSVASLTVSVAGPPVAAVQAPQAKQSINFWRIAGLTALGLVALILLRRISAVVSARQKVNKQQRLESEAYAFEQLSAATRSNDHHATYERLLAWLDRLDGTGDAMSFAARYGDPELQNQLIQLSSTLYSNSDAQLDVRQLQKPLSKARQRFLDEARLGTQTMLPNLNP